MRQMGATVKCEWVAPGTTGDKSR